jgi:hypothetical protein
MSIKVNGLAELTDKLKKFGADGEKSVKKNLNLTGDEIQVTASRLAPGPPISNVNQRIEKDVKNEGFTVIVGVQGTQDFDAWLEFGTGLDFIDLITAKPEYQTPEILALAETFLGKIKPRTGTLKGRPYLFPAFFEHSPKLLERLKRDLQILADKV